MANKTSERVKLMKKSYIQFLEEGKTIAEIADDFQLSVFSVYGHLQEIADENGVSRDSLLYCVHNTYNNEKSRMITKKERVIPEELQENFSKMQDSVDSIIKSIDETLQKVEEE